LLQLKNPGSIATTPEFSMTIKEQDDIILNVDQNGLTYTATPGVLSEILIEPENYRTRASVFYDFSFVTTNPLYMFGDMAIIIPP